MEIIKLSKYNLSAVGYKTAYKSKRYLDIVPAECGFLFEYKEFEEEKEFCLEDEFFSDWLESPSAYGAFEDDKMLGYVEGSIETWNNRYRISNICVFDTDSRSKGIGTALMERIMRDAEESGARMVVLETQTCNDKAIAFYRKHGFEIIGFDLYAYSNNDPERHEIRIEMGKII